MRRLVAVALILLASVTVAGRGPVAAEATFQVIVHPEVEGTQIPRAVLASLFLMEATRWGDGRAVSPVDQSLKSEVRASFSEHVLGKSVDGVAAIWHRKMVAGVRPPIVKPSDEEVIAYVASTEGSIGYVSALASLPPTVRAITVAD